MRVRLNLIGSCSVTQVDEKGESPFTTSPRLLFHLAAAPPDGLYRSELARQLWPMDEPAACQNRLRVALSKLRARAPEIVLESKNRLQLNTEIVAVDLWQIRNRAVLVEDEVSPILELEGWMRLKEVLAGQFAPGFNDFPFEGMRLEWAEWAISRSRRGAELALSLGRYDSARELALAGLNHLSSDRELWNTLLTACKALGDLQPARRLYGRVRADARQSRCEISPDLLGLEKELREASEADRSESSPEIRKFAYSLIKEGLEHRPDLVLPLLAAPEVLPLVGANPRLAAELLEAAVGIANSEISEWPRCAARLIGLWAWQDESGKVQRLAPEVLRATQDPLIRRAVFNALAASLAIACKWREAEEALDQAMGLAEESGSRLDAINVDGNRACYLWMQGHFDESEMLYGRVLAELKALEGGRAKFDLAVAMGNRAFIPIMRGDFDEGRIWLQEAVSWKESAGVNLPQGLEGPCLCMLKVRAVEFGGVCQQMRLSLMSLFAGRSRRMQLAGLEYAALSLLWIGRATAARSSLEQIALWRQESGFVRCAAEVRMIESAMEQALGVECAQAIEPPDLTGPEALGAWIVKVLREEEAFRKFGKGGASLQPL